MSQTPDESPSAGTPHRALRIGRRIGKAVLLIILWLCPLTILGLILLYATPLGPTVGNWLTCVDPLDQTDAIVVLGGQIDRAVEAARLYHEGYAPRIVVSSFPEDCPRYVDLLSICNVPVEAIAIDPHSVRTHTHPRTIARLDGIDPSRRLLVVTSRYHTRRVRAVFDRAGYSRVLIRCPRWELEPVRKPEPGLGVFSTPYVVYELLGLAYYKLRGWI